MAFFVRNPFKKTKTVRFEDQENPEYHVQLPVFSGTRYEDVNEFVRKFGRAAEVNGWSDIDKSLIFPCQLSGAALLWYEAKSSRNYSFDDIITRLENVFANPGQGEALVFTLAARRQENWENVWEYFFDVLQLCNRFNPQMREEQQAKIILKGLRFVIYDKIFHLDNNTLENLRSNIQRAMDDFNIPQNDEVYVKVTDMERELKEMRKRTFHLLEKSSRKIENIERFCELMGSLTINEDEVNLARKKKSSEMGALQGPSTSHAGLEYLQCLACEEYGHDIKYCPNKKRFE